MKHSRDESGEGFRIRLICKLFFIRLDFEAPNGKMGWCQTPTLVTKASHKCTSFVGVPWLLAAYVVWGPSLQLQPYFHTSPKSFETKIFNLKAFHTLGIFKCFHNIQQL